MSKDCWEGKYGNYKKFEKAEKATDGYEDDMILYSLTKENKKENSKKKVWFMEDIKQPLEAGLMCTINDDTCFCS